MKTSFNNLFSKHFRPAAIIVAFLVMLSIAGSAAAQTGNKKFGTDSIRCAMNLSLYREFYRQKNYADALAPWRWVFLNCPLASQNVYIEGPRIIGYQISKATDARKRSAWIDTLKMVYDRRVKYFGADPKSRESMVRGREALDLMTYAYADSLALYRLLQQSVAGEGIQTDPAVATQYFLVTERLVKAKQFAVDSLLIVYDGLSELSAKKLAAANSDTAATRTWKGIRAMLESRTTPYAGCDELIRLYTKKFRESPADTLLLQRIIRMLERRDCIKTDLYADATESLHRLLPTPQSALLTGKMCWQRGDVAKAESFFSEAANGADEAVSAKANYYLAAIKYDQKNYSAARSCALKSLAVNPTDGNCYILIGDMYAASAPSCGQGEIAIRAGYWAAVDKYLKAKAVDASVADEANRRIAIYSSNFPTRERLFFNDIKEGSVYTLGCWIGESTIVRASK